MAISRFTHRSTTESIKRLPVLPTFLITKFFRKGKNHPTRLVDQNDMTYSPSMAPMIEVGGEAQNVAKDTYSVKSIAFPKIRMKTKYTGLDLENTSFNNPNIYIDNTPDQQMASDINDQLQKFKDMITLRIEWMAAKMLSAGGFTYTDSISKVKYVIDYSRSAYCSYTPSTKWDNSSSTPLGDMRIMTDRFLKYGSSGPPKAAIFSDTAYQAFLDHEDIVALLDKQNFYIGQIKPIAGEQYFGNIMGIDCYRYTMTDSDSNLLVPDKKILFISSNNDLFYDFGPVHEKDGLVQTDFFSKIFTQEDPPGKFILAESNPLPMARDINGTGVMTVLA